MQTIWNRDRLIVAGRRYPSSKTCSACGAVRNKLALSERAYSCEVCGLVGDRDLNAVLNLAALAAEFDTAGNGPVQHVEPTADPRMRAGGCET